MKLVPKIKLNCFEKPIRSCTLVHFFLGFINTFAAAALRIFLSISSEDAKIQNTNCRIKDGQGYYNAGAAITLTIHLITYFHHTIIIPVARNLTSTKSLGGLPYYLHTVYYFLWKIVIYIMRKAYYVVHLSMAANARFTSCGFSKFNFLFQQNNLPMATRGLIFTVLLQNIINDSERIYRPGVTYMNENISWKYIFHNFKKY